MMPFQFRQLFRWIALIVAVTGAAARAASPQDPALAREIARQFAASTFPGACVAVTQRGRPVHQQAMGYADVVRRVPYTTRTIQPLGSVSKTVIGLALATAAHQGLVDLDAPISPLLGFALPLPAGAPPVTLRRLATHTAGIVDTEATYAASERFGRSIPDRPLHAYLRDALGRGGRLLDPRAVLTGGPYRYSNLGSGLAALTLEGATGLAFDSFTAKQVLRPLGLTDTGWFARSEQTERTATLYGPDRQALPRYTSLNYPDGSLRSDCDDLLKYLVVLTQILEGAPRLQAFSEALRPQFEPGAAPHGLPEREINSGLFFTFRRDGSIGHTGSDHGVSAFVFVNPRTGVGKLFMSNIDIQEDRDLQVAFASMWRSLGD